MDLNVLFAPQVAQLKRCYADLGHSPQRLQDALRSAVEHELARTLEEVDGAKAKIDVLERGCDAYRHVLSADGASLSGPSNESGLQSGTYLARIEQWQAELARLQRQYTSRRAHVDRLIETLGGYRPILGDFVPSIEGSRASDTDTDDTTSVRPIPSLRAIETALASCTEELHSRTATLQSDLQTILQLWSELALLPAADDGFEAKVLRHLGVSPRLVDVGEGCMDFCGDFDEAIGDSGSDEDGAPCETPSRKSGSHVQLCSGTAAQSSLMRPGSIVPTTENMSLAHDKRVELEVEQTRRTETLQALYDELIPLWRRFDVADEDVDAFVQANCGCTLTVLEAYESELRQMRELKSQHMAMFISKVREDIALLWDQLMMNADERRESFPHFFYDLAESGTEGEGGGVEPSDEMLAMHEDKVRDLKDELATRARPLELVRQYMRLLDEARELEESAKDTSRLMSRGTGQKRDPGRLLREEKMRKRIKIIKPKVEEDLLKVIPAWEEESGRPFIVNGARFLDSIELPVQQQKKRPRTVSASQQSGAAAVAATAVATPQHLAAAKRRQVEGSAARSVSASSASNTTERRQQQQQQQAQPTPTMASRQARHVTGPSLPSFATPSSQPRHRSAAAANGSNNFAGSRQVPKANGGSATSTTTMSSISSVSLASQATDATTLILKSGPRANGGGMHPPPPPTPSFLRDKSQAGKVRQAAAGRPSLLLEASLRHGPRPSSDFAKPASTGAGSKMRPLPSHLHNHISASGASTMANDSLGPNWAVLDDDDENLLMM